MDEIERAIKNRNDSTSRFYEGKFENYRIRIECLKDNKFLFPWRMIAVINHPSWRENEHVRYFFQRRNSMNKKLFELSLKYSLKEVL